MATPTTPKPAAKPPARRKPAARKTDGTPTATATKPDAPQVTAPKTASPKPKTAKAPAAKLSTTKPAPRKPATPAKPAARANPVARLAGIGPRAAISIGAVALAAGAGVLAFLTRGRINELLAPKPAASAEGHVPTDLLDPNRNADDRAVADFRPNIDAPMTDAEREALRPPVGSPTLVASR